MSSSPLGTTFAEATAVKALSSHSYEAYFPDDWCIGSVPHGGYVTAVFLQVAARHFSTTLFSRNQPHTIALHLDFLRRTQTGPALFTVKDTKLGRQASVIQLTLSQGDFREEVIGTLTQGNISTENGVSFSTNYTLHPPPAPANFSLLRQDRDENWAKVRIPFTSFRRATVKTEFYYPRYGQRKRGSADEWIRLATGEKWTNATLGYVCDTWPMPVESFIDEQDSSGAKGTEASQPPNFWYPTLLLNLDVKKALPDEGVEWLFVRVDTKQIKNGRMDLDIVIMDEAGDIVALSHHIALAVSVERNVSRRKEDASKI